MGNLNVPGSTECIYWIVLGVPINNALSFYIKSGKDQSFYRHEICNLLEIYEKTVKNFIIVLMNNFRICVLLDHKNIQNF